MAPTDPSPTELVERAHALVPRLRAEQADADADGGYSAAVHEALREGGLYRILHPARYGGLELDLDTFYRVVLAIATGHPGAGWCYALATSHVWVFASHWPAEAQDEILGDGGAFICPFSNSFTGSCRPVAGGYVVDGTFAYASGAPWSTHLIGIAPVGRGDGPPQPTALVVPRASYRLLDDWGGDQTLGLQASGSQTVRLDEVFVPERHTIPFRGFLSEPAVRGEASPGAALHGNPLYLGPLVVPFHLNLLAVVIGAARAAIDDLTAVAQVKREPAPPHALRRDNPGLQHVVGEAIARTDTAEAGLFHMVERYTHHCRQAVEHGRPFTVEDQLRLWGVGQQSADLASAAVRGLLAQSGTSATRHGRPMGRYLADVTMYSTHRVASEHWLLPMLGRAHLGLPSGFFNLDG